jgi:hypothetical protein
MKLFVLPLLLTGLLVTTSFTPACSECTASATVYVFVGVTDRVTRMGTDAAQVTIEGRPCSSQGLAMYACPVTDAEGSFEIVATLDGRRSVGRAEAAANACGGETRPARDVVRLLP